MNIHEMKMKIKEQQDSYIHELLVCLKSDPSTDDYYINYNYTEEYLYEILEKDGSVLKGLIHAMELYLNK